MKLSSRAVLALLLTVAGVVITAKLAERGSAVARSSMGPYTAVLEEHASNGDGAEKVVSRQTWVRREDGAVAMLLGDLSDGSWTVRFRGGTQVIAMLGRGLKNTWLGLPELEERSPNNQCLVAGETALATETLEGHQAAKVKDQMATAWYALDYACAPLRKRMDFEGGGYSESRLVSLTPTAAPVFFHAINDLREVPPSEMATTPANCDGPCLERRASIMAERDRAYLANRRRAGL